MNTKEFEELTGDIYNNQNINDFKITIYKKKTMIWKMQNKHWVKVLAKSERY